MASVTLYSGTPNVIAAKEDATAGGFKKGDVVKWHSTGMVRIATKDSLCGIALNDAKAVSGADLDIDLISTDNIYVVKFRAAATSQALVGDRVDFVYTAGGHTLNEAGASATEAYCVGLHPGDAVATTGGRLLIRFLAARLEWNF